eukprot:403352901
MNKQIKKQIISPISQLYTQLAQTKDLMNLKSYCDTKNLNYIPSENDGPSDHSFAIQMDQLDEMKYQTNKKMMMKIESINEENLCLESQSSGDKVSLNHQPCKESSLFISAARPNSFHQEQESRQYKQNSNQQELSKSNQQCPCSSNNEIKILQSKANQQIKFNEFQIIVTNIEAENSESLQQQQHHFNSHFKREYNEQNIKVDQQLGSGSNNNEKLINNQNNNKINQVEYQNNNSATYLNNGCNLNKVKLINSAIFFQEDSISSLSEYECSQNLDFYMDSFIEADSLPDLEDSFEVAKSQQEEVLDRLQNIIINEQCVQYNNKSGQFQNCENNLPSINLKNLHHCNIHQSKSSDQALLSMMMHGGDFEEHIQTLNTQLNKTQMINKGLSSMSTLNEPKKSRVFLRQ